MIGSNSLSCFALGEAEEQRDSNRKSSHRLVKESGKRECVDCTARRVCDGVEMIGNREIDSECEGD
jgi:radical SAM protein with 4Fe4S-binding SPASM domain